MPHTCSLSNSTEPVHISLRVHGLLACGATMGLFDQHDALLEEWTMQTDESGSARHTLITPSQKIASAVLTWEISVASLKPQVDSGVIELTVVQVQDCVITPIVQYQLHDIGQAADGDYTKVADQLTFSLSGTAV